MKKILVIYLFAIFASYSCSDDNSGSTDYYNPVEGEWNFYSEDGSLLHTRIYTHDFEAYFSVINTIFQTTPERETYSVENNNLYFKSYTQTFELIDDTLRITNSKKDQITKYIRKPIIRIE